MIAYLSNLLLLYPIAFTLFLALRLSEASSDGHRVSIGVQFIRSAVFVLFILSLLGIGCRLSVVSIVWAVLFGIISVILLFRLSRLNRSAVTMTLLACEDRPQIQRAAALFANENGGFLGSRLRAFKRLLAHSVPWSTALESAGLGGGSYERLTARLTERFGRSLQLTDDLNGPLRIEIELERLLARLSMLTWIGLFGPVFLYYRARILPMFLRMLEEFDIAAPASLQSLNGGSALSVLAASVSLIMIAVFMIGVMIWIFPALTVHYPFRLLSGSYYRCLGLVAFSRVAEHIPQLVDVCRETANIVPVKHVSDNFRAAAEALERGQNPTSALAVAGLVKGDRLSDFNSILNVSGVAWAARQLAKSEIEVMLHRYSLTIQFLVVAFTLLFALLVSLIGFGMFQALTLMIRSLA